MKVRVIKEVMTRGTICYNVEVKRWYWPFWVEVGYNYDEKAAIEIAKRWKEPENAVIWKSYT